LDVSAQKITDQSLNVIAASSRNLEVLNLAYCEADFAIPGVTDAGIKALAQGCHRLRILDLTASSISDEGLEALAENCYDIEKIKLTSCRDVEGRGIAELLRCCTKIQDLRLDGCDGLTDEGVMRFASECAGIRSICIGGSWSSALSDSSLDALASGCQKLETLQLQCLDAITNTGVKKFVDANPSLQTMSVVSCELITSDATMYAKSRGVSCLKESHLQTQTSILNTCVDLMCDQCFPGPSDRVCRLVCSS